MGSRSISRPTLHAPGALKSIVAGFESAMQAQKDRGRDAQKFNIDRDSGLQLDFVTEFTGYEQLEDAGQILAILKDDELVDELKAGEVGRIST